MTEQRSRHAFVKSTFGLAGDAPLRPLAAHAADVRFATNPFTLGVASGYPEPNAIVLWRAGACRVRRERQGRGRAR